MSLESLIGIIGVVVGVLLSELIRRRNRIEAYSINLFERKLPIYEKLSTLIKDASSDVNKILKDEDFNDSKKTDYCFEVGLEVVEFMSKNQFYINEELGVHIGATFVKPGDIIEESDQNTKADLISDFNEQIKDAQKMIADEIGISKINKSFKSITKVKHSSPIIDYYRELKREV